VSRRIGDGPDRIGPRSTQIEHDAGVDLAVLDLMHGLTGQSPCAAWISVWHSPDASIRTSS
jgi:hypothetical protein